MSSLRASRNAFRQTGMLQSAMRRTQTQCRFIHIQPRASPRHITAPLRRTTTCAPAQIRWSSSKSIADEKIEEITELFATAKDEFEIAMEETEKMTVYAEDDRAAAREELDKVTAAFREVVDGSDKDLAEEVQRRIGQRIRELEQGVKAMEELAQNQD